MKKQRIHLEYELHSSSPNIIWPLISNEAGLQKWIANTVTREGDKLTFTWGEEWSHHEQRTATIVEEKKMKLIRLEWDDEAGEEDNFWQMEMVRSDITNDYILSVIDHAVPEDLDWLHDIWDDNLYRLHQSTGL
ncbi:MAG: hypothetical protein J6M40_00750 [Prevotella sp.]|jgi:hypothetical protein|nr:hypothetical protein [Prevotella sp.]